MSYFFNLFSASILYESVVLRVFFNSVSVTLFKMRLFHAYVCCESPLEMVIKIQHMLLSLSDHGIHMWLHSFIFS